MPRFLLALIACVSLAGCAMERERSVTRNLDRTVSDKEQDMGQCQLLGEVHAVPAASGVWFTGVSSAQSIKRAEDQARAMGATNIVWQENDITLGNGAARGQAYKCR